MNRREAIQRFSVIIGGSLLGADSLLAKNINWENFDADDDKNIGLFSKSQVKLMNEIAETIIPTTDTPGAKAAKTGQFMATMVSDCYEPDDQQAFIAGLQKLQDVCTKRNGKNFMKCSPDMRHDLLVELDNEQRAFAKTKKREEKHHYFRTIKDLVLLGYFTSEIGATQALRYVPIPGKYETIDYKKGDRAFS